MLGLIGSFSPKFYPKITKQRMSKSIGFLIVLILIVSAVLAFKYTAVIKNELPKASFWLQQNFANIISDLPEIEITNGKLVTPRKYYIKEWENRFAFIIEPRQERLYSTLQKYSNAVVLSETKVVLKITKPEQGQSEMNTYDLDEIKSLKLSPNVAGVKISVMNQSFNATTGFITAFFDKLSLILYPLILLWLILIYSFNKPIQLLFFSLLSLVFNNNLKQRLTYRELINIGIYALVPCTVLGLLKELSGAQIPFFSGIYVAVYIVYLALGIKANGGGAPAKSSPINEGEVWKESA